MSFPNPTSDIITMSLHLEAPSKIKIKILNGLGQIILKEESNELGNDHLKHFDLSNCASGIYYLYLEVNLQSYLQKIIKH